MWYDNADGLTVFGFFSLPHEIHEFRSPGHNDHYNIAKGR